MAAHTLSKVLRFFNHTRGILCHLNSFNISSHRLRFRIESQCINMNSKMNYSHFINIEEPTIIKKAKTFIPRITLLCENDEMTVVTLEDAEKMAKGKKLKLVKIVDFDKKSQRPIYKLMELRNYIALDAKTENAVSRTTGSIIKNEKTIYLRSKISEHDLNTKVKSIRKMLEKKYLVQVAISVDGDREKANEVANCIKTTTKDIAEIKTKGNGSYSLRINLRPILDIPNNQGAVEDQDSPMDNMK